MGLPTRLGVCCRWRTKPRASCSPIRSRLVESSFFVSQSRNSPRTSLYQPTVLGDLPSVILCTSKCLISVLMSKPSIALAPLSRSAAIMLACPPSEKCLVGKH